MCVFVFFHNEQLIDLCAMSNGRDHTSRTVLCQSAAITHRVRIYVNRPRSNTAYNQVARVHRVLLLMSVSPRRDKTSRALAQSLPGLSNPHQLFFLLQLLLDCLLCLFSCDVFLLIEFLDSFGCGFNSLREETYVGSHVNLFLLPFPFI